MTHVENERLAVVETRLEALRLDLADIKKDVKTLVSVSIVARAVPWAALVAAAIAFFK